MFAIGQRTDMFITVWITELSAETWQGLEAQPWPERNHQVSGKLEILTQREAEETPAAPCHPAPGLKEQGAPRQSLPERSARYGVLRRFQG